MTSDLNSYVKFLGEQLENEGRDFIQLSDESFMILLYSRTSSGNDNFLQSIDKNGNLLAYVNFQSQPFPVLSKIFYSSERRIFLFGTANDFNFDKFFLAEVDDQGNTLSKKNISNPILEEKQPDKIYLLSTKLISDMGMIGIMYGINDPSKEAIIENTEITNVYFGYLDYNGTFQSNCEIEDLSEWNRLYDFTTVGNSNFIYFFSGNEGTSNVNVSHEMNCAQGLISKVYLKDPLLTVQNVTNSSNGYITIQANMDQEELGEDNIIKLIRLNSDLSEDWSENLNKNYQSGKLTVTPDSDILILYDKRVDVEKLVLEAYNMDGQKKFDWSLEDVNGKQKARQVIKTADDGYALLGDVEFDGTNRAVFIKLNANGEVIN